MRKGPRDGRICGPKGQDSFILKKKSFSWQCPLFQSPACQDWHRENTCKWPCINLGGNWVNPAAQTTARGFAFVFMALNEAVSLLGSA